MVPTTIPATTITAHKFRLHTSSKCPKEPAAALLVYQVLSARISYTLDAQQSPCREQRDKAIREKTDVLVSRGRKDIKQCSSTVDLQSFVDGKRACMHTPCGPTQWFPSSGTTTRNIPDSSKIVPRTYMIAASVSPWGDTICVRPRSSLGRQRRYWK